MISVIILFNIDIGRAGYMKRELKMKKTIIEEFKDQEELLNIVSNPLGFSLKITITSSKTATLTIIKKNRKIITLDTLDIEIKSQIQLIVKKGEEIITDVLYYRYLLQFIYHYLYYKKIKFLYQFNGR